MAAVPAAAAAAAGEGPASLLVATLEAAAVELQAMKVAAAAARFMTVRTFIRCTPDNCLYTFSCLLCYVTCYMTHRQQRSWMVRLST
jgi:hypothetical protein